MKSIFRWLIALVLLGSMFALITIQGLDFEQLSTWKIVAAVALIIVIWLIFRWRRTMRLEDNPVRIQLLDD